MTCTEILRYYLVIALFSMRYFSSVSKRKRETEKEMLFYSIQRDSWFRRSSEMPKIQQDNRTCCKMSSQVPDFGQARDSQNGNKMAELGAKMEPRGRQDVQDGTCLAILRPIGESSWAFWKSWGRFLQKWLKYENEHHYSVLATFSGLGGSGWRLSGLS